MDTGPKRFFEFDSFRVDVAERELRRAGEPVALTPKVFDMLLVLLEHKGRTVEKSQLIEQVWGNVYVEDGSLNRSISTLRKALGDDPTGQRFIKTLPKRGYRFTDEVKEVVEGSVSRAEKPGQDPNTGVDHTIPQPAAQSPEIRRRVIFGATLIISISALAAILAWTMRPDPRTEVDLSGLTQNERRQLEKRGSADIEAYRDYVKGRALWNQRSAEGLHESILLLERAVAGDPNFALAHAALADAYAFDVAKRNDAKARAQEAIRLDPTLGEPYATIGFVQMFWEWDLVGAGESFRKAVDLSPDYATAHQWYGIDLVITRHGGAGLAEMKRAQELEPDSLAVSADLCQLYYFLRKYDDAIMQCRKTLETDASFLNAHFYLYDAYTAAEMYDDAVSEFFRTEGLKSDFAIPKDDADKLRQAYSEGGIRKFWRARIEYLEKNPHFYKLAQYHARLAENEEALELLSKSIASRDFDCVYLLADPVFQHLSKNERFIELARSINTP
jgi:DNA-binding winged helix-turn-helix (wHTH) protein